MVPLTRAKSGGVVAGGLASTTGGAGEVTSSRMRKEEAGWEEVEGSEAEEEEVDLIRLRLVRKRLLHEGKKG